MMKKRAMKKWIPKKTVYCYTRHKDKSITPCKWWSLRRNKPTQDNGFCLYLNSGDWEYSYTSLLWDMCKECGIKENM